MNSKNMLRKRCQNIKRPPLFAANLSEARGRRGGLPMDPMARPGQQGGSLADRIRARNAAKVVFKHLDFHYFCLTALICQEGAEDGTGRGSVKRQSDIQREKKKSRQEEREEEKARKASYYRRVTGETGNCGIEIVTYS